MIAKRLNVFTDGVIVGYLHDTNPLSFSYSDDVLNELMQSRNVRFSCFSVRQIQIQIKQIQKPPKRFFIVTSITFKRSQSLDPPPIFILNINFITSPFK